MEQHQVNITASNKPEALERILRVTRHRGFMVKQLTMVENESSDILSLEFTVASQRPITLLYSQLEKLWDVNGIEVLQQKQISA